MKCVHIFLEHKLGGGCDLGDVAFDNRWKESVRNAVNEFLARTNSMKESFSSIKLTKSCGDAIFDESGNVKAACYDSGSTVSIPV